MDENKEVHRIKVTNITPQDIFYKEYSWGVYNL